MRDSGWVHYISGEEEHFDKIASSTIGIDACYLKDYTNEQIWSFIPWVSIRKIVYDSEG
jgi:hypothetical protein